ncbi:MAG: cell division protein FtsZ [Candidatus Magasanikbacteria bacterium CG10_big_fil_rev_8_21_14_0_10_36_32]|uniref:Cell division protein FtsZ n=1 Tax=Candidatus Magasanikbacteria bacterium CG10_big_fil_rev_8_21_14_0_10_36_32 TaxID=1974646 RepID=A0A2M6W5K3_9BACT|nr:MAG: cell division protein FtsZ [Candidatus Magasanikbacteria bacterium CG10_big_fil_rev_8_21_14_0_10_36_32]
MPQIKPVIETFAKIKVIGIGGSGGSAVNRMINAKIKGVDFIAMNTDVQSLGHSLASQKIHIGKTVTRGLGAGMDPEQGRKAAEEAQNEIREVVKDTDMVFITCGLGGGTGSGASPVVAEAAREAGALTVAVVTKPFSFEGVKRREIAEKAWENLAKNVDAIITVPNERIGQVIDKQTTMLDAFKIADDVLRQGVQGISELITMHGIINVDFADVKTIMRDTGSALMGIGIGKGENRAIEAAKMAISSPLLELSIDGARGILFIITGGSDVAMSEIDEAAKIITSSAAEDAKIIFGVIIDEEMKKDEIKITVIATGFDDRQPLTNAEDAFFHYPFFGGKKTTSDNKKNEDNEDNKNPELLVKKAKPAADITPVGISEHKKPAAASAVENEEELEIPTFLRRKMGI